MNCVKKMILIAALAIPISACSNGTGVGGGDIMASRGNLSAEAIRLQTSSSKLISLEKEQRDAERRARNFTMQGGALGAAGGALAGLLACELAGCSDAQRNLLIAGGAVTGGTAGAVAGNRQAQQQNATASAENAIRRRIAIAGQQLSTSRTAKNQAISVARMHQNKLARLQSDIRAGKATQEQLAVARSDAQADARQVRNALSAMEGSSRSMSQSRSQSGTQNQQLARSQAQLNQDLAETTLTYNAMVESISKSAL